MLPFSACNATFHSWRLSIHSPSTDTMDDGAFPLLYDHGLSSTSQMCCCAPVVSVLISTLQCLQNIAFPTLHRGVPSSRSNRDGKERMGIPTAPEQTPTTFATISVSGGFPFQSLPRSESTHIHTTRCVQKIAFPALYRRFPSSPVLSIGGFHHLLSISCPAPPLCRYLAQRLEIRPCSLPVWEGALLPEERATRPEPAIAGFAEHAACERAPVLPP
jgi:hypothetical protein